MTDDDEVWETYIKVETLYGLFHICFVIFTVYSIFAEISYAKQFKRKGLAHYDKFKEIFAGKSASGALAMGPLEVPSVGKAAATAKVIKKVPCVLTARSAPTVEEVRESSDEIVEVGKKLMEKSTAKKEKVSRER